MLALKEARNMTTTTRSQMHDFGMLMLGTLLAAGVVAITIAVLMLVGPR